MVRPVAIAGIVVVAIVLTGFSLPVALDNLHWPIYGKWKESADIINGFLVLAAGAFVIAAAKIQSDSGERVANHIRSDRAAEAQQAQRSIIAATAFDVSHAAAALSASIDAVCSRVDNLHKLLDAKKSIVGTADFLNLKNIDLPTMEQYIREFDSSFDFARDKLSTNSLNVSSVVIVECALMRSRTITARSTMKYLTIELPNQQVIGLEVVEKLRSDVAGLRKSVGALNDVFLSGARLTDEQIVDTFQRAKAGE